MRRVLLALTWAAMIAGLAVGPSQAQRPQLPPNYGAAGGGFATPTYPQPLSPPPVSLGPGLQPFDPYASQTTPLPGAVGVDPWSAPAPTAPPPWSLPGTGADPAAVPPVLPPVTPVPGTPLPGDSTGSTGIPSPIQPRPLFQTDPFAAGQGPPYQRLFEDTGFRYTWLWGDEGAELEIHEIELSTTMVFPNFMQTAYGLRFTPGFAFLFLDGPSPPVMSEMPGQLYSAYVDGWWNPLITPQLSAEINVRTGVYSDFQTFSVDSIRVIGAAVAVVRVTPSVSAKLGAVYLDRNHIKLLPAAGITWEPNQQTRWDIFFPAPKLATYWKNVRNAELWWYLGAEYGGGAWTFEREVGPNATASERVDINDIRVFLGIELFNLNRYYAFFEGGYVFDRELYYVHVPEERVSLDDTFMLRAGLSF